METEKQEITDLKIIRDKYFTNHIGYQKAIDYALSKIKELENTKSDLYAANNIISDYIDIASKQEKMIELMALALAETEFDKCCDYCNTDVCTAHEDIDERAVCVKIYFENKANEEAE